MSRIDPKVTTPLNGADLTISTLAIILAALLLRIGLLTAPPEFDELYHLLAARGFLELGELRILDGHYERVGTYTRIVAGLFDLTGSNSLATGRLFSLMCSVVVPGLIFLFVRVLVGTGAAAMAAVFSVFWPQAILEAQLLRFYSLHVLLFVIGAMSTYFATLPDLRPNMRGGCALVAVITFFLALQVQITTLVGLAGIGLWLVGFLLLGLPVKPRQKAVLLAIIVFGVVAAFIVAYKIGAVQKAWSLFRFTPENAIELKDYVAFYHNSLRRSYETFWPLFPVAVVLACLVNPKLTLFCASIFVAAFAVHSFGAMKANRYLSYAMPFFFTINAMAITLVLRQVTGLPAISRLPRIVPVGIAGVCAGFVLLANGFVIDTAKLAAGKGIGNRGDWTEVPEVLADWSTAPFFATDRELHMIAYLGDYDADLRNNLGWETEFGEASHFAIDTRTGRHAVRAPEGWRRMLACRRDGVLVVASGWWLRPEGARFQKFAHEAGLTIETRKGRSVTAVRWRDASGQPSDCSGVPQEWLPA